MPKTGAVEQAARQPYIASTVDDRQVCGLRRQLLFGGAPAAAAAAAAGSGGGSSRGNSSVNGGTWVYHTAVAFNLVARVASAMLNLTDIPSLAKLRGVDLSLLLQVLEVLRRSVWSVFRIEWECIKRAFEEGGSAWHGRHM